MIKSVTGRLIALGATNGLIATVMAALAAHTLKGTLSSEEAGWYETAVTLQFATTAGFVMTAFLGQFGRQKWAVSAAAGLALGLGLFSGSLYVLAIAGAGTLGGFHWVTPIGGLLMMIGWASLGVGALRSSGGPKD